MFSVHINRFQTVSPAFSNLSTLESVFKMFRFSVDGRPFRIKKVAFSNLSGLLGGVYTISGRLSSRREFTPVPSYGSVFVYMIPTQNVMPAQVITGASSPRFLCRSEIFIPARKFIPVSCKRCMTVRFTSITVSSILRHYKTRTPTNTVQLFISPRNESCAVVM